MGKRTAILSVNILGDARGAINAMGEVEGKSSKLGGLMKGAAGVIAGAAAAGGAALVGLGVAGVAAAGDLEQSIGAVDSVFKGSADQVHAFADQAAESLGLTGNEYRELATLMGTQLKNGGTSIDELAGKTDELMVLGADLSSMFGGSTVDAVSAISSALKGERDPIEAYGVSLKQASIDARAAELGFQKVGGALTDEAQQAATLSLIMEQTADAHGNFGRETNTFAGQVSILTAQWGNFISQVGMLLLPILTTLLTFVTGSIMPGLQSLADVIGPVITGALDQVIPVLEGFMSSLGGVEGAASPLQGLFDAIMPAVEQFGGVLSGVLPMVTGMVQAMLPHLMSIGQAVLGIIPTLMSVASTVLPLIIGAVTTIMPLIAQAAGTIIPAVIGIVQSLLPILASIAQAVIPAIVSALQVLIPTILQMVPPIVSIVQTIIGILGPAIQWLLPLVTGIFGALVTQVQGAIQIVTAVLESVALLLQGDFSGAWQALGGVVDGVMTFISGVIDQALTWISQFTGQSIEQVKQTFIDGWNLIRTRVIAAVTGLVANAVAAIVGFAASVSARVNAIRSTFIDAFQMVRTRVIAAVTGLVTGAVTKVNSLLTTVREMPTRIKNALGNLGSLLRQAGKDLIQGMINGVSSMGTALKDKARGLANGAVDSIKSTLGIASPSRVMMQIGEWTGEGLIRGVERMQRGAGRAMAGLVTVPDVPTIPLTATTGRSGGAVREGDIHVTINGLIDDAMVAKLEAAIVRAKQRRGAAAGSRLVVSR